MFHLDIDFDLFSTISLGHCFWATFNRVHWAAAFELWLSAVCIGTSIRPLSIVLFIISIIIISIIIIIIINIIIMR